jgi:hypothetical protein
MGAVRGGDVWPVLYRQPDNAGPCDHSMTRMVAIALFLTLAGNAAWADSENCLRSREYLLGSLSGDLLLPPQAYNDLFKICNAAATMSNVRDAYILRDGGIAVVPKQDSIEIHRQRRADVIRLSDAVQENQGTFLNSDWAARAINFAGHSISASHAARSPARPGAQERKRHWPHLSRHGRG